MTMVSDAPGIERSAGQLAAEIDEHRVELATLISQRDQRIIKHYTDGLSLAAIARLYRLTPERVRQLVNGVSQSRRRSGPTGDSVIDPAITQTPIAAPPTWGEVRQVVAAATRTDVDDGEVA